MTSVAAEYERERQQVYLEAAVVQAALAWNDTVNYEPNADPDECEALCDALAYACDLLFEHTRKEATDD
ncbi:MAG: hypothetical protein M0R22_07600 [Dehalococcoidia bacterium]|jgi:hypothetical protein|nr:hypothetical protein [Dehalococcoidia bacterium]